VRRAGRTLAVPRLSQRERGEVRFREKNAASLGLGDAHPGRWQAGHAAAREPPAPTRPRTPQRHAPAEAETGGAVGTRARGTGTIPFGYGSPRRDPRYLASRARSWWVADRPPLAFSVRIPLGSPVWGGHRSRRRLLGQNT
jgi:hypothetical protein